VIEYVCDCGKTRVVVEAPASYPYSDASASVQCSACGTYVKDYPVLAAESWESENEAASTGVGAP
jgi:hypothetical protein